MISAIRVAIPIFLLLVAFGCLAVQSHATDKPPNTTQPAGTGSPASDAQQTGMINAAIQGLTGIAYSTTLPWGAVILLTLQSLSDKAYMAWIQWLSHRREMARLKGSQARSTTE